METASPTPMGSSYAPPLTRRTSQRQALRRPSSRPTFEKSESNPIPTGSSKKSTMTRSQSQQYHMHDSSDDEIPVPMKLSALTKALLNDDGEVASKPPSPRQTRRRSVMTAASVVEERRQLRSGSAQPHDVKSSRPTSPARGRDPSPVRKRVIRLSNTPKSLSQMNRRSTSLSRSTQRPARPQSRPESRDKSSSEQNKEAPQDINTPAQQAHIVRVAVGSSGAKGRSAGSSVISSARSGSQSEADRLIEPGTVARTSDYAGQGSVPRPTGGWSRPEDNPALQSSMRIKRVGKVPGSFLSGPARRGRRRQSEEEAEAALNDEHENLPSSQDRNDNLVLDEKPVPSYYGGYGDFASGSPVSSKDLHRRQTSVADLRQAARHSPLHDNDQEEIPYMHQPPAATRPQLPPNHNQENEQPVSLGLPKSMGPISIEPVLEKPNPPRSQNVDTGASRLERSVGRQPLVSMSRNTPHRAAPPPPKMSVVDMATTTAGAATTSQARQRRNVIRVNGKCYTRLDCLGRGGSGKVYRVTAENGKMWALKRVSLEGAEEITIRGYKGEIDLLQKLGGEERVINLLDYEMNDEKKMLTLVMEMGDLDLATLLRTRQNMESSKFDPVFVRYYWKEMLECLHAVHQHEVVHSDLKPANFVLVQGRLKLIDFGIANAIQTDETVNVHRETQIGTPNYMSPESLMDFNASNGPRIAGRPKLMKLGKPSDLWSLGCILYQMVYGFPPFNHIANAMARCQAIINWDHKIEFPWRGMGGVPVPPSLMRTMRRCLTREQHMRPSCEELLHPTDPFLYPGELPEKALPIDEELLGRIIQSVVSRCRERMPTEAESMSVWPSAYWASVRKAMNASKS